MKRNKLFIAGLVTVFVALCSLTLVSSTWAKYTSTASGTDTAKVARWGFNASSIDITGLFVNAYDGSVQSTVDVIAPGTEKSVLVVFEPADDKAPEVSYNLSYTLDISPADSELIKKLDENDSFVWTLKVDGGSETEYKTVAAFKNAVETLSADYDAGKLPTSGQITIGWKWYFEGKENDKANDALDTYLGNNAETLNTIILTLNVTATQID